MESKKTAPGDSAALKDLSKLSGYKFDPTLLEEAKKPAAAGEIVSADALLEEDIFKMCEAYRWLALDKLVEYDPEDLVPWGPPPEALPKEMVPEVRGKIAALFGEKKKRGKSPAKVEEPPFKKNTLEVVKPDWKQKEITEKFSVILRKSWRNLRDSFSRTVFNWVPELKDKKYHFGPEEVPYLILEDYEKYKRELNYAKRATGYPDKRDLEYAYLQLVSYFRVQLLYLTLAEESYETALAQLEDLMKEYDPKGEDFRDKSNRAALQLSRGKNLEESPLFDFREFLKREIRLMKAVHPKIGSLGSQLKSLTAKGKKVLVLCDRLETANAINFQANKEWGIRTAVVHGVKSGKKKNSQRQQYIFEQFKQNRFPVIIATPTAEHGTELPEFDTVICYSPSATLLAELKAMAKLKAGGEIITLSTPEERGKFFKTRKEKTALEPKAEDPQLNLFEK